MKSIPYFVLFLVAAVAWAAPGKTQAGPKGGRLLEGEGVRAEFFVNAERKVEIAFYDASLKPLAPADKSAEVIAETGGKKTALQLAPQGSSLVSTSALPAGHELMVVVRITAKPGERPQNFRVPFHEGICGECKLAEYACVCEHHDEGGGHHH